MTGLMSPRKRRRDQCLPEKAKESARDGIPMNWVTEAVKAWASLKYPRACRRLAPYPPFRPRQPGFWFVSLPFFFPTFVFFRGTCPSVMQTSS
jgi:hypothetical protein